MKYLFALVFVAGALAGTAFYLNRSNHALAKTELQSPSTTESTLAAADKPGPERKAMYNQEQPQVLPESSPSKSEPRSAPASGLPVMDATAVAQAVDLLVSPNVSHQQKRAAWKQLKENGGLDQAIHQLEQRTNANPNSADCTAALGQAYLQKCSTTSDVREQGILAMQADKVFDTALNLDPSNWEARFTKAVALSYWPATMNKGDEVITDFLTLIQQQETQPQQPQFAESYILLGDQYQKAGRFDDARSVWGRGSSLFPENQQLKNKLLSSP